MQRQANRNCGWQGKDMRAAEAGRWWAKRGRAADRRQQKRRTASKLVDRQAEAARMASEQAGTEKKTRSPFFLFLSSPYWGISLTNLVLIGAVLAQTKKIGGWIFLLEETTNRPIGTHGRGINVFIQTFGHVVLCVVCGVIM